MLRKLLFIVFVFANYFVNGQSFTIDVLDNNGLMHQNNIYHFTQDSLVITARSDYGRSNVDYLKRSLSAEEKKSLTQFLKSFPADSLKGTYFNEYSNLGYIDAEHFPREVEINIVNGKKTYHSKATNAYVSYYARLIQELNPMLSDEVKIKFDKNQFNAFY